MLLLTKSLPFGINDVHYCSYYVCKPPVPDLSRCPVPRASLCCGLPREKSEAAPGDDPEVFGPKGGGASVQGVAPALPQSFGERKYTAGGAESVQPERYNCIIMWWFSFLQRGNGYPKLRSAAFLSCRTL